MKFKISEIFYSLQGEGRYVGVPSIFMRTFGCNFQCAEFGCKPGEKSQEADAIAKDIAQYDSFEKLPLAETGCDSYASWHPAFKSLSPSMEIEEIVSRMQSLLPNGRWKQFNGNDTHLVITGGEPLLGWQRNYPALLQATGMGDLTNITFETNGTQDLSDEFGEAIQEWHMDIDYMQQYPGQFREVAFIVSPKLSVSGESWEDAIRPEVIRKYQEFGPTYLKFVVEKESDFAEVDQAVHEYRARGFMGPVYVMPVGGTDDVYKANHITIADAALKRGYYYSPRLHVDLWGNGWGK
jgi:organic radical activating enzyme